MHQQKDPDKFFQEYRHLLEEMPSPQVWVQLEQRLDGAVPARSRRLWVKRMAVAAGVAVLVGFAGLTVMAPGMGLARNSFRLEAVGNNTDYPQALMAIALQKNPAAQAPGIREGEPGKKFR